MRLTVVGVPIPQGSKTAFPVKRANGKMGVVVTEGKRAPNLRDWRRAIADRVAALAPAPSNLPVVLTMTFYLPRPKSSPKRRLFPDTRPDIDKLARAVCDAMRRIAYGDDAQIVDLHVAKRFAQGDRPPRLELEIRSATEIDLEGQHGETQRRAGQSQAGIQPGSGGRAASAAIA